MSAGRRLTVLHALAAGPYGGLEQVVRGLVLGHAARGHRVAVAATVEDLDHPFLRALWAEGAEVHPVVTTARAYLRERAELAELIGGIGADVVHTHGYRSDVVAAGVARDMGVPVVSTVHGFTGGGWRNRAYEWLQVRRGRAHDAVVAVSAPLAVELRRRGARPDTLRVIRNAWGGRAPLRADHARTALRCPHGAFHVGWAGRLSAEKGPDVFVAALEAARDLPWTASLLGDGPARPALEARATRGLGGRVRFLGPVADAGRLFTAFDAFVLSSRTEGTPIVLFEAMAARVPIVATHVGGVPEVITSEEAILVPPDDPDAIALALRKVFSDPAAALRRCDAASHRLDTLFSVQEWLDAYEALYAELSGRAGGGTRPALPRRHDTPRRATLSRGLGVPSPLDRQTRR